MTGGSERGDKEEGTWWGAWRPAGGRPWPCAEQATQGEGQGAVCTGEVGAGGIGLLQGMQYGTFLC